MLTNVELVQVLQARIDEARDVIVALEAAVAALRAEKPTMATPARGRRAAVADGSPASRVLSLAAEPIALPALVAQADDIKLKPGTVKSLVEQLVASGHLTRTGKSRSTRYQAR